MGKVLIHMQLEKGRRLLYNGDGKCEHRLKLTCTNSMEYQSQYYLKFGTNLLKVTRVHILAVHFNEIINSEGILHIPNKIYVNSIFPCQPETRGKQHLIMILNMTSTKRKILDQERSTENDFEAGISGKSACCKFTL